jgi:hypothetical protein
MTTLVAVLVGLLVVACVAAPVLRVRTPAGRYVALGVAALLAVVGVVTVLAGDVAAADSVVGRLLALELFVVAVVGGGPVTATVLWLVDSNSTRDDMHWAGEVLRGGAWIGAFERAATFAALAAGWPEGLAVVLALKGLGRYSELRTGAGPTVAPAPGADPARPTGGVAERFLIGSFASLLWGCAAAGAYLGLTR